MDNQNIYQPNGSTGIPVQPTNGPCPRCGYCPACGRAYGYIAPTIFAGTPLGSNPQC